jgi:riboflavin transporter
MRTAVLDRNRILLATKFIAILILSILAPLFKLQFITGPIVNALLFVATITLGLYPAILIGILPSIFSLSVGLLPTALASMIAFIIISNAILVLTFNYFQRKNYWLAVALAGTLKYSFLLFTSQTLVNLFLKGAPLAKAVIVMMSWPQLITALLGGVLAYIFLKSTKYQANRQDIIYDLY